MSKDAINPFVESTNEPTPASAQLGSLKIASDILSVSRGNAPSQDRVQPSIAHQTQSHERSTREDEPEIVAPRVTRQEPVVTPLLHLETAAINTPIHSTRVEPSEIDADLEKEDLGLSMKRTVTSGMSDSGSLYSSAGPKFEEEIGDRHSDVAQLTSAAQSMRIESQSVVPTTSRNVRDSAFEQASDTTKTSLSLRPQVLSAETEELKEVKESSDRASNDAAQTADYSVPLKDDDVTLPHLSSPTGLNATTSKSPFSPSAVTFAALPTRDLPRGRSIGATKHQRMTSHLVENTVPEIQAVNTPGPIATATYQTSNEHVSAVSKAARDSKSGGPSAGSSWISRKVLAGSGAEDLRKSLAASKRPSTIGRPREEESEGEADEMQEMVNGGNPRASEAVTNQQRFSLASKTPQPLAHSRQTLGASTISRPAPTATATPFVDQPQSNLSKMIADLQEKRAVASFNASITRATLPSLQLGRGAQGIATMGISSGLLGRTAIQSSLDRARAQNNQTAASLSESLDVFDERPKDLASASDVDLDDSPIKGNHSDGSAQPSTTEELNQAVDEILRKISTEREMAHVQENPTEALPASDMEDDRTAKTLALASARLHVKTPTSITPNILSRTASVRAEEQEVEELTKRTHTLSINARETMARHSESLSMPGGFATSPPPVNPNKKPPPTLRGKDEVKPNSDNMQVSTTPVNSPPKSAIYRPSLAHMLPPPKSNPVRPSTAENVVTPRERPTAQPKVSDSSKAVSGTKPSTTKLYERPATSLQQKPTDSQSGLSRSQAVAIDEDDSNSNVDDSVSEDMEGDQRFDEKEDLADEVAKLAKPLDLSDRPKHAAKDVEGSESDAESVEEVDSNGTNSRAPVRDSTNMTL